MSTPTGKTYRIDTVADMLAVPVDRVPFLLDDLANYLAHVHATKALNEALGAEVMRVETGFNWIDDGKHETTLNVRAV